MDMTLISAASTAIGAAREFGKAALAVRDFNQMSAVVSQLNEQLLKAQDALFVHNAQLMALQQEVFEAREQLRVMREAIAEKNRYSLFEITPGAFVYRVNQGPDAGGTVDPASAEPLHYLCQKCFDAPTRTKSILRMLHADAYRVRAQWFCPNCTTSIEMQKG